MKNFVQTLHLRLALGLSISALGLGGCNSGPAANAPKQAVVFVTEVKATELFDTLNYPARVNAKINTTVLSESDGIVVQLVTALGHNVHSREKLLVLSHTDPIYQYAPVQITAPISGVVSTVDVSVGTHVTQGQKLLSIMDPSQVRVHLELPAQDFDEVKKGSHGEFRVMNHDVQLPVIVDGISPYVDPATGTAAVEMSVTRADQVPLKGPQPKPSSTEPHASPAAMALPKLSAGLQGQVTFKVGFHSGISIPTSALFYKGNDPYVSVVETSDTSTSDSGVTAIPGAPGIKGEKKAKVKQIQVALGRKQRGNVEVLRGLFVGMRLVERTSRFVADGDTVTIESSPAP